VALSRAAVATVAVAVAAAAYVVEGAEVEHHADGRALDLREDTAVLNESVVGADHLLVRLDRVLDEVHGAVELLRRARCARLVRQ
jgi:hypothetical protein